MSWIDPLAQVQHDAFWRQIMTPRRAAPPEPGSDAWIVEEAWETLHESICLFEPPSVVEIPVTMPRRNFAERDRYGIIDSRPDPSVLFESYVIVETRTFPHGRISAWEFREIRRR